MKCYNNKSINCTCTYTSCSRHGLCCECVSYHRENNEIPGCFFSKEDEKTYNRSVEFFIKSKK
jgi:hypothetical protein